MLRSIELEVLATVERGDTVSDVATDLDKSESYISRAVTALSEKDLIYMERDGRRKRIIPSDARAVEIFQDLVRQHTHIDFPELLTGTCLDVLCHFDEPRTVTELAVASSNYRNTVNRNLKRLQHRGLVGADDGRYHFNGEFDRLHDFARELAHHLHRHRLESVAPSGTILWEDSAEFLAQTETEIEADGFQETGLARFAAYDLQFLLTSHRYYFYSEEIDSVSPVDLCCHTLLIDDDIRHRSYCLLLLCRVGRVEQSSTTQSEGIEESTLRERAAKYGLKETIETLLRYLDSHGDIQNQRLPAWPEFQALAAEYEVTVPQ